MGIKESSSIIRKEIGKNKVQISVEEDKVTYIGIGIREMSKAQYMMCSVNIIIKLYFCH